MRVWLAFAGGLHASSIDDFRPSHSSSPGLSAFLDDWYRINALFVSNDS
jgi:hypothetical protein